MTTFTPEQKLALIKHLAAGKPASVVATIMHTTEAAIIDVAKSHGYPDADKLGWAADILEKNLSTAADAGHALEEKPLATGGIIKRPTPVAVPDQPELVSKPDDLKVLINTGKGHTSKRIQAAADRAIDALDKLRDLIREDGEKNAEKRAAQAAKAAAKAEVERLEAALKAAKAKLKGGTPNSATTTPGLDQGPTAAQIRAWAAENDIECPKTGRVPADVRDAYSDAHLQEAS